MAIDLTLTSAQQKLQRNAREFAVDILQPLVKAADEEPDAQQAFRMLKGAYVECYKLGFATGFLPKQYGGGGNSPKSGIDSGQLRPQQANRGRVLRASPQRELKRCLSDISSESIDGAPSLVPGRGRSAARICRIPFAVESSAASERTPYVSNTTISKAISKCRVAATPP